MQSEQSAPTPVDEGLVTQAGVASYERIEQCV